MLWPLMDMPHHVLYKKRRAVARLLNRGHQDTLKLAKCVVQQSCWTDSKNKCVPYLRPKYDGNFTPLRSLVKRQMT